MERLIRLREDLKARREVLHNQAEAIETEIYKLNQQVEDLDFYIQNVCGKRTTNPVVKVPATMTTREVMEHLYRGKDEGFTARELVASARMLPNPVDLKLESVRSFLSSQKVAGKLKTHGEWNGETLYVLK